MAIHSKRTDISWNLKNRHELYSTLLERFGPYSMWNGTLPVKGKGLYDECLLDLAKNWGYGPEKIEAIRQQIRWGTSPTVPSRDNHFETMRNNVEVAVKVGFLTKEQIPEMMKSYLAM